MNSNLKFDERKNPIFQSIQEFEIIKELGNGAFARVFQAIHKKTKIMYAIKRIFLSKLFDSDRENIENEVEIHSKISHKHIVKFHDFFMEDRIVNIVLDLYPLGNLYRYMRQNLLSDSQVRKIFYQSCLALQYLHNNQILLRDLKPENILIDAGLNVKLCDFGWATFLTNTSYCRSRAGTYAYMSPESLKGVLQTAKSDIWSLGVLLYELIHNHEPYTGTSCPDQLLKIQNTPLKIKSSVDIDANNLISAILKVNPKDRPSVETILKSKYMQKFITFQNLKEEHLKNTALKNGPVKIESLTPNLQKQSDFSMDLKINLNSNLPNKSLTKISKSPLEKTTSNRGVFNHFLEKYTTPKYTTNKELTQSLIEKVLSPSPNKVETHNGDIYLKFVKTNDKNCRKNVFLDFSKSPQRNKENIVQEDKTGANLTGVNFMAMVLKKNIQNKEVFTSFEPSFCDKFRSLTPKIETNTKPESEAQLNNKIKFSPFVQTKTPALSTRVKDNILNRKIILPIITQPNILSEKIITQTLASPEPITYGVKIKGFFDGKMITEDKVISPTNSSRSTLYTIVSSKHTIKNILKPESPSPSGGMNLFLSKFCLKNKKNDDIVVRKTHSPIIDQKISTKI